MPIRKSSRLVPPRPPEVALRHRVNAGRRAVESQVPFFQANIGKVECDWKEDDTRVTFADFAISEKILAALRADFPADDLCSEESDPAGEVHLLTGDFAWVLDPIDGTNNYYFGLPWCAISLALLYQGEPIYGFLYDFSRQVLLEGGPELGLLQNGRRLVPNFDPKRVCAVHFPLPTGSAASLVPLLESYRVRAFGSSALVLGFLAAGKLDGVLDGCMKVWDIAAGCALLAAVGIKVHFTGRQPFPLTAFHVREEPLSLIAGTPAFLDDLHRLCPTLPK